MGLMLTSLLGYFAPLWRRRKCVLRKQLYLSPKRHGVTTQKRVILKYCYFSLMTVQEFVCQTTYKPMDRWKSISWYCQSKTPHLFAFYCNLVTNMLSVGTRGGVVGWGTALQPGRSRVRFLVVSLEFSIFFRSHGDTGVDAAFNRNEYREYFLGGGELRRAIRRADKRTTSKCLFSWNMGTSTSWNPQGLSRPVIGLLFELDSDIRECSWYSD